MKARIRASLGLGGDRWKQAGPPPHYSSRYYGGSRLQKSSCVLCLEGKRLVIIAVIMPSPTPSAQLEQRCSYGGVK